MNPGSRAFTGAAPSARAIACHSCSERTSPALSLSAMMASHAADAADIVVVYGTPCWSAARRIE